MSSPQTSTVAGKLLAEFPPVSYADWRKLVEAELKGALFDKRMFTDTYEGIKLQPIYCRTDVAGLPHVNSFPGFAPFVRGTTASGYARQPWEVSQEITVSTPQEFNEIARASLNRGLNALNVVLDRATRNGLDPDWAEPNEVGLAGLSIATLQDLDRALQGIQLDHTSLFIRSGASALPFAALLMALANQRRILPGQLRGCIEMDPLGVIAHEGKLPQSLEGAYREMAVLTRWTTSHAPQLQTICVHGRAWHEAGGSAVEELAFTLATGLEYLREMNYRGLDVNTVAPRMRFAITVGSSFFKEIAKLRALRLLWSQLVGALDGNEAARKLSLHVRTSQWNKTVCDPHNNLLRATVEAFAAALGGCDSLQVGAFDEVLRPPDDFSQRLARNTQLILQKECHLTQVVDPAGGSWYVESLTADLAKRAWALFQEVEKHGGMAAALCAGFPQQTVAATAAKKLKAVTSRRDSIVGVNQYANPKEKPLPVPPPMANGFQRRRIQQVASHRTSLDDDASADALRKLSAVVDVPDTQVFAACVGAVSAGATLGEITRALRINDKPGFLFTPVCLTRAAAPLERLRAAMNRQVEPAQIFLCNMGPLKEHKARADFSRSFFAVGGYDAVSPAGFKSPAEAAEAFAASKAKVAVICSVDDNYPALVPPLIAALRAKKSDAIVVLAGYPADQVEAHKQSGVHEFIHVRADVLEVLSKIHAQLGIV
jgi:methylmalonyl-CoA mutase